jgi:hypothetical protein
MNQTNKKNKRDKVSEKFYNNVCNIVSKQIGNKTNSNALNNTNSNNKENNLNSSLVTNFRDNNYSNLNMPLINANIATLYGNNNNHKTFLVDKNTKKKRETSNKTKDVIFIYI